MIRGKNERPQAVFNISGAANAMQKKPSSVDRDRKTIKNPLRENHARSLVLRLKSSLCIGGGRNWGGFFKKWFQNKDLWLYVKYIYFLRSIKNCNTYFFMYSISKRIEEFFKEYIWKKNLSVRLKKLNEFQTFKKCI